MTLIAAFEAAKTPTLIGDFLITKNGESHSVSKKILKLTDNIVIGWTGHFLAAQEIIPSIQESLGESKRVTIDRFTKILTEDTNIDCGTLSINIIGWLVDPQKNYCFRWNSAYPTEIYFDNTMFDGSGESFARALIGDQGVRSSTESDGMPQNEWLEFALLQTCGRLMNTEIFNQSLAFDFYSGFCFETIFLNDANSFEYIDQILYIGVTCIFDENKKLIHAIQNEKVIKYEAIDNTTRISIHNKANRNLKIHLIGTPGDSKKNYSSLAAWSGFKSKYYCIGIKLESPLYATTYSLMVDISKNIDSQIIKSATMNSIEISLSNELIEQLHEAYCNTKNPTKNSAMI